MVGFTFAQNTDEYDNILSELSDSQDIDVIGFLWISTGMETAMYKKHGLSFGPSLAFAYNRGVSIGLQSAYFFDFIDGVDVLELGFLLRFNLQGMSAYSGPFIQVSGGQALFFRREDVSLPAFWGTFFGGINFGWRFHFSETFFLEPVIRGGYPFLYGGGLSIGIRF